MKIKILSLSNLLIVISIVTAWWFVAFIVEPFLLYQAQQVGFNTSISFLKDYLFYPGGISSYLSIFITQFFSFNSIGSLLIVTIASVQGFIALKIVSRLTGKTNLSFAIFALTLLPAIMVLCNYNYPYHISIRLLFVFLFTWGFYFINKKYPVKGLYIWPALALLLFYIANGAAVIVFAVSTAFIIILTQPKKVWLTGFPLILLFAGVLPIIAFKLIFPESLVNLYMITEVKHPEMPAYNASYELYGYYLVLPFVLSLSVFLKLIQKQKPQAKPVKGKKTVEFTWYSNPFFVGLGQVVVIVALGYFMFVKSFDAFTKKQLYIEYYAENGKWKKVLEVAESIEKYDYRINFQINRAYARLGQLPEKLFGYPQLYGPRGLILDSDIINGSLLMPVSDLYFDLGFMSEAAHWAFEGQTLMPNSPRILKRLVMVNLVNRKYELAENFLKVLDQNMLYTKWVDKYQKYISDTTLANNDPLIAEKRRFTPGKTAITQSPSDNLKLLHETNKDNRMAFDYLMSVFILESNFPEFIKYVQEYPYYNIKTLPDSWAEALSVYILRIKSMPPFVSEENISKECMQRFKVLNNIFKQFDNNKEAAKNAVRKDFENTYWYYSLYLSPQVTNVFNVKR